MNFAIAFVGGAALALLLQQPTARFALRIGAISRIRADRWSHPQPLQRLAGLAFSVPVIVCCLYMGSYALASSLLLLVILGVIDDARELSPSTKFIGQLIAIMPYALLADGAESQLFTMFWLLLHINATNMFDNMDGSLAVVGGISLMTSGLMLVDVSPSSMIAFTLAGGMVSFLRVNWHPAKAFMGDTGSMVVGMVLGVLSLELISMTHNLVRATMPAWLILLDSVRVCVSRVIARTPIWIGGLDHLTHRLALRGHPPKRIAISFAILTTVFSLMALAME